MTSAAYPSPGRPERRRRRSPHGRGPRPFTFVGWLLFAGTAAVGRLLDPEPGAVVSRPVTAPVMAPVVVALVEPEHPPVRIVATPPKRPLPKALQRPFQTMHAFASPLIMPRLSLPRVLTPHFTELSDLLTHAKPGQPVSVRLSAYCLQGIT